MSFIVVNSYPLHILDYTLSLLLSRQDATALATSVTTFLRLSECSKLDEDCFVKIFKESDARSSLINFGRKRIISVITDQMFHIKLVKIITVAYVSTIREQSWQKMKVNSRGIGY